ncbi:hypothetical protein [Inquilinus sp. CA228]|uniref:hypothetical protein n=1 Tax=Inquilinus sp. CA228 TaxID=3455609 RepID=UPI003F8D2306
MGVDFIGRISRAFEKHLDLARVRLGTCDLFTRVPIEDRPTFPIDVRPNAKIEIGQELIVEISGQSLVFRDVLSIVAKVDAPPADIYQAVEDSCGVATAIVQDVHELSAVAEVTLC